jgi:hypothetical protein
MYVLIVALPPTRALWSKRMVTIEPAAVGSPAMLVTVQSTPIGTPETLSGALASDDAS